MKKRGNSRPNFLIKDNGVKSKRSQGEVITTILIILLVLAAVVIVWQAVKWTTSSAADKTKQTDKIDTSLGVVNISDLSSFPLSIPVTRNSGAAEIEKIRIVLKDRDGNSKSVDKADCIPAILETKICAIISADLSGFIPISYEVYPVFKSNEVGFVADKIYPCTPNCLGKTCGDNGCGGSCGNCASGKNCVSGTCACSSGKVDCSGTCHECCDSSQCFGGKICNTGTHTCYNPACTSAGDCPDQACKTKSCVSNTCQYVDSSDTSSCTSPPVCFLTAGASCNSGVCTYNTKISAGLTGIGCSSPKVCDGNGNCICSSGKVDCSGTCYTGDCCDNSGCAGRFDGKTLCSSNSCACPSGKVDCSGTCYECCDNSQCVGRTDGKTLCSNHICAIPPACTPATVNVDCAPVPACKSASCVAGSCVYSNSADSSGCTSPPVCYSSSGATCNSGSCVYGVELPPGANDPGKCDLPNSCDGDGRCGSCEPSCAGAFSLIPGPMGLGFCNAIGCSVHCGGGFTPNFCENYYSLANLVFLGKCPAGEINCAKANCNLDILCQWSDSLGKCVVENDCTSLPSSQCSIVFNRVDPPNPCVYTGCSGTSTCLSKRVSECFSPCTWNRIF